MTAENFVLAAAIGENLIMMFYSPSLIMRKKRFLENIDLAIEMNLLEPIINDKGIFMFVHDRIKEGFICSWIKGRCGKSI